MAIYAFLRSCGNGNKKKIAKVGNRANNNAETQ